MIEPNIANREGATLETARTLYVEGSEIRFAYRKLGPVGRPDVALPLIRFTSAPSSTPSRWDCWGQAACHRVLIERKVDATQIHPT